MQFNNQDVKSESSFQDSTENYDSESASMNEKSDSIELTQTEEKQTR